MFDQQNSSDSPDQVVAVDETIVLPQEDPVFAWLVVVEGSRRGRLCRLKRLGSTIGRADENDLVVDGELASRYHARIYAEVWLEKPQFYVQDLASANGTFVNGERIARQSLIDNDRIAFGETVLVFKQLS
ncbi:MAG: FHA domain-containing protein [Chloroflexi bacterium]|nr:FHA domain-containing protein [Chloroflexota bacterium]